MGTNTVTTMVCEKVGLLKSNAKGILTVTTASTATPSEDVCLPKKKEMLAPKMKNVKEAMAALENASSTSRLRQMSKSSLSTTGRSLNNLEMKRCARVVGTIERPEGASLV